MDAHFLPDLVVDDIDRKTPDNDWDDDGQPRPGISRQVVDNNGGDKKGRDGSPERRADKVPKYAASRRIVRWT